MTSGTIFCCILSPAYFIAAILLANSNGIGGYFAKDEILPTFVDEIYFAIIYQPTHSGYVMDIMSYAQCYT